MLYVFVGSLIIGGVILAASIFVGDSHGGTDHDLGMHVDAEGIDVVIGAFRSIRFWTFFLAFFGLTGTLLLTLGVTDSVILSTAMSLLLGSIAGYTVVWAFRKINQKDANSMASESDLVGKTGRLLVAVGPDVLGKIRLQVKGSTVDMLAKSDETIAIDAEAIVIEMDGTMVRVATIDAGASEARRGD